MARTARRARRARNAAADPTLRRHLLLVAVVAVAWRAVAWALLARTPFFTTPVVDASHFDLWARALMEGQDFQPGAYFKPPLYPHLLAAFYQLGLGLRGVYALQGLAGMGTALLTLLVARRLLPPRGALAAGLVVALLPILPFFEFQLLAESWTTLLVLMAVVWLLAAAERPARALSAGAFAGAALALAALGRPNLVPVIAAAAAWLGFVLRASDQDTQRPHRSRNSWGPVAALLLASAVVLLPTTLHNWRASGQLVPVSANLGANLVAGNRDQADGVSAIAVGAEWDDLQRRSFQAGYRDPAASSRWLTGQALAWIGDHPGRAAELLGRRVLALVSGWEPRNNIGAAWLAERHGVVILHRWWPGTWLVLPLAVVGLVAVRWGRAAWLLALVVGVQALSVLPFFVNARFRMPLLPLLAVFAVVGVLALAEARRRPGPRRLVLAAVLVAAAVVTNGDWLKLGAPRWGAEDAFNEALINLRGYGGRPVDEAAALALLAESADLDPAFPDAHERTGSMLLQQAQLRLHEVRRLLAGGDHGRAQAQAQLVLRRLDEAASAHGRALAAFDRSFNSLANLGAAGLLRGETLAELATAAAAAGDQDAAARLRRDAAAACGEAVAWFDRALALDPAARSVRENRALADGLRRDLQTAGGAVAPR
ncbi:MAG: glycosyltransferase family 39 protein [Candidatus Krumholzibacteriia bacterium]